MNERIRELLVKAILEVGPDDDDNDAKEKTLEKFAEFIIRECIANCNDLDSMKFIADHFEIKIPGLNDEIF
jgi:hypothetical protein